MSIDTHGEKHAGRFVAALAGRESPKRRAEQITYAAIAEPASIPFTGLDYHRVKNALENTFGNFPIRLEKTTHRSMLMAMANAVGKPAEAAYTTLIVALNTYGAIEVRDV